MKQRQIPSLEQVKMPLSEESYRRAIVNFFERMKESEELAAQLNDPGGFEAGFALGLYHALVMLDELAPD
jgi:hypothetical protein